MNVAFAPKLNNEPVDILLFERLLPVYTYKLLVSTLEGKLRGTGMNIAEIKDLATNICKGNFKIVNKRMYINGILVEAPTTHINWAIV